MMKSAWEVFYAFTIISLMVCTPIPCDGDICLPASICKEVESGGGCGKVCRQRANAIDTIPVYSPRWVDLRWNTTRAGIRSWLQEYSHKQLTMM